MIIELSNGKDRLFQWDQGQKVKVPGDIPTVHFKWGNEGVPFDVVDGWVEIAPELTQKPGNIYIWTYNKDHTLDAARIPVEKRPKPTGYAYTPTEIKTWESLDKRIDALEAANVQPNWDQNDTSAADYVRGRTHYVGAKHDVRIINQYAGHFEPELGLIVGNSYRVWYDAGNGFGGDTAAEEFVCQTLSAGDGAAPNLYDGKPYVGNADANGAPNPYLIFDNSILLHTGFSHVVTPRSWKIEGDFADIKTLDLKYIDPTLLKRIQALEDGGGVSGVSSVNGQTGAVTITAAGLGALTEDDLQSATNAALAQAKASGEFDGAQGPKGDTGATGPQGPAGAGLDVTGATVGQTVKISAVDSDGVPTAWVPVDMTAGGETWEKIADVALTADVSIYRLADFGTYRKVKALISRSSYVSGLNKNVWFRVSSTEQEVNTIAATYVTSEYGYIASEINAEMGDMFTHVGVMSTNNRISQQHNKRTIDVASPAKQSAYGLYMVFVDTSVVQSGDTVNVYGVKR